MAPPKRSCKKEASVRNRAKHSNGKRVYSVSIIIATSYRVVHHSDVNGNDASCKCSFFFCCCFFAARDVRTYGASHKEGRCLGTRKVEGLLIFHLNA